MECLLHCQRCGHWPKFAPESPKRYFLTGCGRLFCETCLRGSSNACPLCNGHRDCQVVEVNAQTNMEVKQYFTDPLQIMRESLTKPFQILQFQANLQRDCVKVVGKLLESQKALKMEISAIKNENAHLRQINETMNVQLVSLQEKLKQMSQGGVHTPFSITIPTESQGTDIDSIFKQPTHRPNVQVFPVATSRQQQQQAQSQTVLPAPSISFSPASSDSGFQTPTRFGPSRKRNAYYSENEPRQRMTPEIFGTPSATPRYISGMQGLGMRTMERPNVFHDSQNRTPTSEVPGKTPDLINRLRNLKCYGTPANHFRR